LKGRLDGNADDLPSIDLGYLKLYVIILT
jgi:hypothetical protein